MRKLLEQLELQWYAQRKSQLGELRLDRVWGLAIHLRDKRLKGKVSDFELFGLTWETLNYCMDRFDPSRPPKKGEAGRRSVEDRFIGFFKFKLVRVLKDYADQLRGAKGLRCRVDHQEGATEAMLRLVNRAVDKLSEREQKLITLRYWDDQTFQQIASALGLGDRFRALREHDRIIARLRKIVDWEYGMAA